MEPKPKDERVTFRLDRQLHQLLKQHPRSKQGVAMSVVIRDILLDHCRIYCSDGTDRKFTNKVNK